MPALRRARLFFFQWRCAASSSPSDEARGASSWRRVWRRRGVGMRDGTAEGGRAADDDGLGGDDAAEGWGEYREDASEPAMMALVSESRDRLDADGSARGRGAGGRAEDLVGAMCEEEARGRRGTCSVAAAGDLAWRDASPSGVRPDEAETNVSTDELDEDLRTACAGELGLLVPLAEADWRGRMWADRGRSITDFGFRPGSASGGSFGTIFEHFPVVASDERSCRGAALVGCGE